MTPADERFVLRAARPSSSADDLAREVADGLAAEPKRIPCRFFYDEAGSKLFEAICELPEYYLTRAEDEILATHANEIADSAPEGCDLIELGSGDARKTRRILAALLARRSSLRYVPIDISSAALVGSASELLEAHPSLSILALAAEYERGLAMLREESSGSRFVLWLGSNIGNFERADAAAFLRRLELRRGASDQLLLGVDLRKDRSLLEAAYDDPQGVTARFNKNVLVRLNADLDGDFDVDRFGHVAFYDERAGRIEMHLESLADQVVCLRHLELEVRLRHGERIHTESSYKYSPEEIRDLARSARMIVQESWIDAAGRFSLNLLLPTG
jgi:dimethylhistidine N-methyltransferase